MDLASVLSHVSFSAFLDQVQDGLYIIDASRTIVFWNRAAEELTGFSAAQMVGKRCIDATLMHHTTLTGDSLCRDDVCLLERCMQRGVGGTLPQLILMSTASGRPLPISLSVGPLQGPDGESIGAIAIFRSMREEYQQRKLAVEIQKRMITLHGFSRNGVKVETVYAPVDDSPMRSARCSKRPSGRFCAGGRTLADALKAQHQRSRFCTAAPDAPLPRLSSLATSTACRRASLA